MNEALDTLDSALAMALDACARASVLATSHVETVTLSLVSSTLAGAKHAVANVRAIREGGPA